MKAVVFYWPGRLRVEDMDLEKDLSRLREVRLNPWLVAGMDSGPCSAVGIVD